MSFLAELGPAAPTRLTPSAWTQARAKLNASAFVALNEEAILAEFYQPDHPQALWCGHRLLAIDGSEVHLPDAEEMGDYFGWRQAHNQRGRCGEAYILGRVSVLYDVNNCLVLHGVLSRYTVGEIELAEQHRLHTQAGDVLLYDRGYCGYGWLARQHQRGRHYICRVPRGSFAAAEALFAANVAGVSRRVWLEPPPAQRGRLRALGLPLRLEVRMVTVRLPTGELEVLVSSLLDEQQYGVADFAEAYHRRWGVEPFYGLLKGRLGWKTSVAAPSNRSFRTSRPRCSSPTWRACCAGKPKRNCKRTGRPSSCRWPSIMRWLSTRSKIRSSRCSTGRTCLPRGWWIAYGNSSVAIRCGSDPGAKCPDDQRTAGAL